VCSAALGAFSRSLVVMDSEVRSHEAVQDLECNRDMSQLECFKAFQTILNLIFVVCEVVFNLVSSYILELKAM